MDKQMHGLVLKPAEADYTDLTKFGTVTIRTVKDDPRRAGDIEIAVHGFDFEDATTCRQTITKAMAWARDVLDAAVRADMLVPGGHIIAVDDGPDEDA